MISRSTFQKFVNIGDVLVLSFCGYSAGSAIAAIKQMQDQFTKDDIIVVLLHDHGSRYVGKIYNDDWMKERGWLD